MEKKINTFKVIASGVVYAFLKENYQDDNINPKDKEKNIIQIFNQLIKIESFGAIPDKKKIIKEKYDEIEKIISTKESSEINLLEYIRNTSKELSDEDREKILDSIIYIILIDKKISDIEKNTILQMIEFLNLKLTYKEALKRYNSSEFKKPPSPIIVVMLGILLLGLITGVLFWQYQKENNVKIFNSDDEIVFNEVYFNKYIIYKNKFNLKNKYFLKQAVFYLHGKADISFNPKYLSYDRLTKKITYTHPKDAIFQSEVIFSPILLVDKIDPKPISKQKAKDIAMYIGIAGGIAGGIGGAKLGNSLAKFFPPQYKFAGLISTTVGGALGGILGGGAAYYFSFRILNGLKLSNKMTEYEENSIQAISKDIIRAQIALNKNLHLIYKKNFEKFIKLRYKKYGLKVQSIVYKDKT